MRKTLLCSFALLLVSAAGGCSCFNRLMECEYAKNQWLKDHFLCGCCHKNQPAAVVPIAAVPGYVPMTTPVVMAPPMSSPIVTPGPQPIMAQPMAVCPPIAAAPMGQPMVSSPMAVCPPIEVCPQVCPQVICQPVQQYCEPMMTDPCGNPCDAYCP